jgi:hypothetical protein
MLRSEVNRRSALSRIVKTAKADRRKFEFPEKLPRFEQSHMIGTHNEYIAAAFLMRAGFHVYTALKRNGIDLLAMDHDTGEIFRVEVRTCERFSEAYIRSYDKHVDFYVGVHQYTHCDIYDLSGQRVTDVAQIEPYSRD